MYLTFVSNLLSLKGINVVYCPESDAKTYQLNNKNFWKDFIPLVELAEKEAALATERNRLEQLQKDLADRCCIDKAKISCHLLLFRADDGFFFDRAVTFARS